jgi:CheY-like chemotaxis protein
MSEDRRKPRIFVVDDEDVIAITLRMILTQQGFDSYSFNKPLEALARARELPPNLLTSDVTVLGMLSGMSARVYESTSPGRKTANEKSGFQS